MIQKNYKDLNKILLDILIKKQQEFVLDTIDLYTNLYEIIDSLDFVEYIMELEIYFGISIPDQVLEEYESFKNPTIITVKDFLKDKYNIVDLVEERRNKIKNINELS